MSFVELFLVVDFCSDSTVQFACDGFVAVVKVSDHAPQSIQHHLDGGLDLEFPGHLVNFLDKHVSLDKVFESQTRAVLEPRVIANLEQQFVEFDPWPVARLHHVQERFDDESVIPTPTLFHLVEVDRRKDLVQLIKVKVHVVRITAVMGYPLRLDVSNGELVAVDLCDQRRKTGRSVLEQLVECVEPWNQEQCHHHKEDLVDVTVNRGSWHVERNRGQHKSSGENNQLRDVPSILDEESWTHGIECQPGVARQTRRRQERETVPEVVFSSRCWVELDQQTNNMDHVESADDVGVNSVFLDN
ncbi:hypothetical protein OGAPHI_000061 [Ogataea philodendri]|uniref:Uncharacterized protein n=1 Tax=Ogataea philodendri TaxID=1378263 RepID=A0A9P8PI02_9ASCO|nr:uncharacterized protein OGAPHI_000061 [Ogataea philodendri]KAH3671875.1 hypothetical protein OGAPHI_000061 [Ogataea philodendri]